MLFYQGGNKMKLGSHPSISESVAIAPDLFNDAVRVVSSLFRVKRGCAVVGFNCKRIEVNSRYADGTGKRGVIEWAVTLQPVEADYTVTAYVDMEWDDDMIRVPALFRDHQGKYRGFSDAALDRFLYRGVDLSEYISPQRPLR